MYIYLYRKTVKITVESTNEEGTQESYVVVVLKFSSVTEQRSLCRFFIQPAAGIGVTEPVAA